MENTYKSNQLCLSSKYKSKSKEKKIPKSTGKNRNQRLDHKENNKAYCRNLNLIEVTFDRQQGTVIR